MSSKIVLIVIGVFLLIAGIALLVAAMHPDWENQKYEKIFHKQSAPANLKRNSLIIGGLLTAAGLGLSVWGFLIHTKVVKKLH